MSHAVKVLAAETPPSPAKLAIRPFNYDGVKLGTSRWQQQYQASRDYYLNVPNDDILHGYRAAALPAPGKALGGWCSPNSNTVFGQWLSGMSRFVQGRQRHRHAGQGH